MKKKSSLATMAVKSPKLSNPEPSDFVKNAGKVDEDLVRVGARLDADLMARLKFFCIKKDLTLRSWLLAEIEKIEKNPDQNVLLAELPEPVKLSRFNVNVPKNKSVSLKLFCAKNQISVVLWLSQKIVALPKV